MNILGAYSGHDAHFCLLRDGVLTHHYQLDRFSRMKHSHGFDEGVLARMLADAKLTWRDIDAVACGGNYWVKGPNGGALFDAMHPIETAFNVAKGSTRGPAGTPYFHDASERLVVGRVTHDGHTVPLYQIDHHLAHCAQAYYMSPFPDATVVSFDGGGDDAYMLTCSAKGNKLTSLIYNGGNVYPRRLAIGNFWTLILPVYAGWVNGNYTDGEGKIMGHAAYGVPRPEMIRAVLAGMRDEPRWAENRVASDLTQLGVDWADWHSQSLKDFSASLQHVTEGLFVEEIVRRAKHEPSANVCLSGGCAYNCVANGEVAQRF
jgi:carbamoyltransferase